MSFDLSIFNANLPAHIQARQEKARQANAALAAGVSVGFPVLSIKGKVWHMQRDGERKLITLPGQPDVPAPVLEVVIVKANPHISKVYYPSGYTEGSDAKPECFSNDGIKPDSSVSKPQCSQCATCPRNAWGSKITENGAKGKECSDSRRIAVAARGKLDDPILLRVPAGSLKELSAYGKALAERGVSYTDVVTRLSFDNTVAHQKLMFKPTAFLEPQEVAQVDATAEGDVVDAILGASEGEIGGQPAPAQAPAPVAQPVAQPAAPVAQPVEQAVAPKRTRAAKPAEPAAFAVPTSPEPATTDFGAGVPETAAPKVPVVDDKLASSLEDVLAGYDDL